MSRTDNFFDEKKKHSLVKDALLGSYLIPYFTKLSQRNRSILYVDSFAGEGSTKDGNKGSPLIAIDCARKVCNENKSGPKVYFFFSDNKKKSTSKLKEALEKHCTEEEKYWVYECDHEELVLNVSKFAKKHNHTVFFYMDPYSHSPIRFEMIKQVASIADGTSVEVLLNYFSPAFLRDALAAYSSENKKQRFQGLTEDFGSEDWIPITESFRNEKITFHTAEYELAMAFCNNLRSCFKYLIQTPIKERKDKLQVKYRMIHLTNHLDGISLMNDNMFRRFEELDGTEGLFFTNLDGEFLTEENVEREFELEVRLMKLDGDYQSIFEITSKVIARTGIVGRMTPISKKYLNKYLDNGVLERKFKLTPKGQPSRAFDSKVMVRRVR